jgi:hypothetical protein
MTYTTSVSTHDLLKTLWVDGDFKPRWSQFCSRLGYDESATDCSIWSEASANGPKLSILQKELSCTARWLEWRKVIRSRLSSVENLAMSPLFRPVSFVDIQRWFKSLLDSTSNSYLLSDGLLGGLDFKLLFAAFSAITEFVLRQQGLYELCTPELVNDMISLTRTHTLLELLLKGEKNVSDASLFMKGLFEICSSCVQEIQSRSVSDVLECKKMNEQLVQCGARIAGCTKTRKQKYHRLHILSDDKAAPLKVHLTANFQSELYARLVTGINLLLAACTVPGYIQARWVECVDSVRVCRYSDSKPQAFEVVS